MKIKDVLLIIGIIAIIYLLLTPKDVKEVIKYEQLIEIQKDTITIYKDKIIEKTIYIKSIHEDVENLKTELIDDKLTGIDSVIIEKQDTIIEKLTIENKQLYEVSRFKDNIILKAEEIDSSRVEQIDLLIKENKREKRKLIGVTIVAGLIVILQIFRK